jgi:WD40 repeat protein
MELSGDASTLVMSWPGRLEVWDLRTVDRTAIIEVPSGSEDEWIGGLGVDEAGTRVAGLVGGDIRLWDASDGTLLRTLDSGTTLGACLYCGMYALSMSPAGDLIAGAGGAPLVLLFDAATGSIVRELATSGENTGLVSFSSDGTLLIATSTLSDTRYAVRAWDTTTYDVVFEHEGTVTHARSPRFAVSADGRTVAVGSEDQVELLDIAGGSTILATDDDMGLWFVAVNADGTQVGIDRSTEVDTSIVIIDVATGAVVTEFSGVLRGQPTWSADGRYLIADTRLLDTSDLTVLHDFAEGHLYALELESTPEYIDEQRYAVSGTVRIDGSAPIDFSGTVTGQESQRYLRPQARLPDPARLEIHLVEHPWRLYAHQPYSLDHWNPLEPDSWQGTMMFDGGPESTWFTFRLWRAP